MFLIKVVYTVCISLKYVCFYFIYLLQQINLIIYNFISEATCAYSTRAIKIKSAELCSNPKFWNFINIQLVGTSVIDLFKMLF